MFRKAERLELSCAWQADHQHPAPHGRPQDTQATCPTALPGVCSNDWLDRPPTDPAGPSLPPRTLWRLYRVTSRLSGLPQALPAAYVGEAPAFSAP
jgi:hypothetical protein